jgi:predicted MFS family arabinose efflux permease
MVLHSCGWVTGTIVGRAHETLVSFSWQFDDRQSALAARSTNSSKPPQIAPRNKQPMASTTPRTVIVLGLAQLLAWGSSFYLPAMLAVPMARELGLANSWVFAAFSWSLVVSALFGPLAGWAIDRLGGRPVLMASSVVFAIGLAALSAAQGLLGLFLAWTVLGVAMAAGLYEGAFATLVQMYGRLSRGPITGITLIAGLASTVGWPVSAALESQLGWRSTCLIWAAVHLLINLPLYAALLPRQRAARGPTRAASPAQETQEPPEASLAPEQHRRAALLLSTTFALTWFISTAMAAHLPQLLQAHQISLGSALLIAALIGPAQVAGRLLEYTALRHIHPLLSARLAAAMHPLGAALLLTLGAPLGMAFALLHGAGNGILTIAKGTLPLVLFGPQGYGLRQGLLMVPARFAQALAPFAFGLALDHWGAQALWLSVLLGLLCLAALLALPSGPKAVR